MQSVIPSKGQQGFQPVLNHEAPTRVCTICGVEKPIQDFVYRAEHKGGSYRGKCRDCFNARTRVMWANKRQQVFDHYGWVCKCCGEKTREFLTIDHINDDGHKDKNPNGSKKTGKELYLLVIKQGFPDKYQTLCMNCNFGKHLTLGCPHKRV